MNILIVPVHSFVDLITNSSSELFICETKKSVDAVKKILKTLLKEHPGISFSSAFNEPEVSKWSFDITKFPGRERWLEMFPNDSVWGFSGETTHPVYLKCEREFNAWSEANPRPIFPKKDSPDYETRVKKCETHDTLRFKAEDKIFAPW